MVVVVMELSYSVFVFLLACWYSEGKYKIRVFFSGAFEEGNAVKAEQDATGYGNGDDLCVLCIYCTVCV